MSWHTRYRVRSYLRDSLWPIPVAAIPLALVLHPLVRLLDDRARWRLLGYSAEGARSLLGGMAPAALTLIALFLSTLLLAVQIAAAQYSPRLISGMLANRSIKTCLSVFAFSYVYCVGALGRVETRVPQLPIVVAIASSIASIAAGLYLIDHIARELRPVRMLARTAERGRAVVKQTYPEFIAVAPEIAERANPPALPEPCKTFPHVGRCGVLQAVNVKGLFDLAVEGRCTIEVVPRVGDFVPTGDPIFRVYPDHSTIDPSLLIASVFLGKERTPEQDPALPFRILVDVAAKALSPAINDPTTAVLAIDEVQSLLREVGRRRLDTGSALDGAGVLRVLKRTPDWDDFVLLAVTEIRQYGMSSFQVARRLQAMLRHLIAVLPACRTAIVEEQLRLLDRGIDRSFGDAEDRARAGTSDFQGIGSSRTAEFDNPGRNGSPLSPAPTPASDTVRARHP